MKYFYLLLSLFALTSCATRYQSEGMFSGGYSEIQTMPDTFIVSFKGNSYTGSEKVLKYVLLRASELTLENGYRYFAILSTDDLTKSYHYSDTHEDVSTSAKGQAHSKSKVSAKATETKSSRTTSGKVIMPGTSLKIKCFKEDPNHGEVIDAEFYWQTNQEE